MQTYLLANRSGVALQIARESKTRLLPRYVVLPRRETGQTLDLFVDRFQPRLQRGNNGLIVRFRIRRRAPKLRPQPLDCLPQSFSGAAGKIPWPRGLLTQNLIKIHASPNLLLGGCSLLR